MYADRYARPEGIKFGSLTIAITVNAALMSALVFMSPNVRGAIGERILETVNIPIDTPPPEIRPETKPQVQQKTLPAPERIETTPRIADTESLFVTHTILPPETGTLTGTGTGRVEIVDPPIVPPVFVDAAIDARFARDLQPTYPAGERRAENEGRVVIKVLVGVDGRVKLGERVSATSDAFWQATLQRALAKWRFRPATRDGVPVEAWRTMTLRFELND